jgi:hypothetical protein
VHSLWYSNTAIGEVKNTFTILVGKPDGKRPLGGPKHGWNVNIKTDIKET